MSELPEKLGEKAIEEAFKHISDGTRDLLKAIGGEAFVMTGSMIGDQFRYWHFLNKLRLLDKTAAKLRTRGVDPRRVLPEHLVPLLASGALVEDETLQERWANLLANAADPGKRIGITASYIEILRQLSSAEVEYLHGVHRRLPKPRMTSKAMHRGSQRIVLEDWYGPEMDRMQAICMDVYHDVLQRHEIGAETFEVMGDNLVRLRLCIWEQSDRHSVRTKDIPQGVFLTLTDFGKAFMQSVSDETPPP